MGSRETYKSGAIIERWTNEGAPGYYTGNPLTKQRDLTADEAQALADMDTANAQASNESTLRTRADAAIVDLQTIANSSGTLTTAQLSNSIRVLAKALLALGRLYLRRLESTD